MKKSYEDFSSKNPRLAAECVGKVDRHNYLAHSIREAEAAVSSKHSTGGYRIITTLNDQCSQTAILTHQYGATIRLHGDYAGENVPMLRVRLAIAHELGHLWYHVDELRHPAHVLLSPDSPAEEEAEAWKFAFYLIKTKSDEHKKNSRHGEYIVEDAEIKGAILGRMRDICALFNNDCATMECENARAALGLVEAFFETIEA